MDIMRHMSSIGKSYNTRSHDLFWKHLPPPPPTALKVNIYTPPCVYGAQFSEPALVRNRKSITPVISETGLSNIKHLQIAQIREKLVQMERKASRERQIFKGVCADGASEVLGLESVCEFRGGL